MRKLTSLLGILLVGFSPVLAQKTVALPAQGIHDSVGMGLGMIVPRKKWLPTRQQCLYAAKDLPSSAILIREVAFQPVAASRGFGVETAMVSLTLDVSMGPLSPHKRSRTFAANHGKDIARVFSGNIQLPKITVRTRQGWHFRIPFQKPVVANKKAGASLVLDFATSSVITTMNRRWGLLQSRKDTGTVKFQGNGYNCHFTKIPFLYQMFPGAVYVGSRTAWFAAPLLPNQPGFLMLGDGGLGSKWGGVTLPIDLFPFGAPSCKWDVRPLVSLPFLVNGRGGGTVAGIRIPSDPRLANAKMFVQGTYAYPKANALGLLFLPSLEWRIGSGEEPDARSIAGYTYNQVPPGKVSSLWSVGAWAPYCRITYN